jgi:hypothetical protein
MLLNILKKTLIVCFQSLYFFIAIWSFCFGFSVSYLLIGLIVIGIILYFKKTNQNAIRNSFVAGCLIYIVSLPFSLMEYNKKIERFKADLEKGNKLSIKDKFGIYGLNLIIGVVAFPIYPEVSKETLLLCIPNTRKRIFNDGFFLQSNKIKQEIKKLKNLNQESSKIIFWNTNEYNIDHSEARYALALNPCTLKITKINTYEEVSVSVKVSYPYKSTAILMTKPFFIRIEEGLFGYLQKEGWLFPFEAEWKTRLAE